MPTISKLASGTLLVVVLVVLSGCQREAPPDAPPPVPQEGRLPAAPDPPAPSPAHAEVSPSVVIPPPACAVAAAASVEEGRAPLTVRFDAEGMCSDAEGTFTWDFGDGSDPTTEQNPTHVYTKAGTYTARVTLADPANDASDWDEATITVRAP